jgi:hypothetical protein
MCKGWKNGKHQQQWIETLELYAFPKLGKRTVDKIDGPMIRDVLAEIWLDIPETARRVRQRIGAVLDWCYAKGLRDSEAPMRSLARLAITQAGILPRSPFRGPGLSRHPARQADERRHAGTGTVDPHCGPFGRGPACGVVGSG